jgi:hypothetical protein
LFLQMQMDPGPWTPQTNLIQTMLVVLSMWLCSGLFFVIAIVCQIGGRWDHVVKTLSEGLPFHWDVAFAWGSRVSEMRSMLSRMQ